MEFAQDVEVFTNLVAADTLTDIDAAVEEVTNRIYEKAYLIDRTEKNEPYNREKNEKKAINSRQNDIFQ